MEGTCAGKGSSFIRVLKTQEEKTEDLSSANKSDLAVQPATGTQEEPQVHRLVVDNYLYF